MILVLGMPRSGTSFVSGILENLGLNFNINIENNLDDLYLGNKKFYQHKNLHLKIGETDAKNFKNVKCNIELPDVEIIKEPYLLFFLQSIKNKIKKIILVIRNPNETIKSINSFIKLNSLNLNTHVVGYKEWNLYYMTFLKNIKETNIPFILVNYNNIENNHEYEINRIKKFLGIKTNYIENKILFKNNNKYDLSNLPIFTKYIYLNLSSYNENIYYDILKNPEKISKIKPNDICYCNSGKKYKKCCNLIRL